ncbi:MULTISPECIES: dTMP kinase [unclassified Enterococcus]|uniref:dTMP kinase n=1 Tax=unclassified Enterococcus TaxID=2608891 RepID=UPI001557504A|nr:MULTISPECIES: dTMP kinase [unclassified Enterococcus]MBS7577878.1 dTMP kinase [Enterococcus sp. MMGLQ5-2]MBS7585138.1 dTMP kinase [Enterococcus sp. MMGLQ5-1]NPD12994.1 dTMP kinase [Enterococcus sp. MMGLQ5-1]NPD37708.1 dTMP kinase [Enterococcus sp. MMGLQ5-2]
MSGIFISIEGPEGSGKTTLLNALIPRLKSSSCTEIIATREPGGIKISEQIRRIILDPENSEMDARTEALLFAASRRQHLVEKVIPALEAGQMVIADRYVDSSLAYQGQARKLGINAIAELNQFATDGLLPQLTLLLDLDPEAGLKRIMQHRQEEINRIDMESIAVHQLVRHGFLNVLEMYPERIKKIDAHQTPDQILEEAYQLIINRFPENFK